MQLRAVYKGINAAVIKETKYTLKLLFLTGERKTVFKNNRDVIWFKDGWIQ